MTPAPFTAEDFARADGRAPRRRPSDAGLTGVLVTPGPDLVYFTGYAPIAITERITLLVDPAGPRAGDDRADPRAARRRGCARRRGAVALTDWTDGDDPYAATARAARPGRAATRSPTRPGRCTCSACRRRCPSSSYVSMTARAADAARDQGRRRARAPGRRRAPRPTRRLEEIVKVRFAGRTRDRGRRRPRRRCCASTATRRSTSPSSARARTAPTRTTRWATGRSRRATWSSSTSAASRTATAPTRRAPSTSASRPTRSARSTRSSAAPSRPASRPCARASPARRSTAPRAR